jgi:hypothetical protein
MNMTKSTLRAGDSVARFEVRLPQWGALSSHNSKCQARLVSLSGSVPATKKAKMKVSASFSRSEKRYPFRLLAPFAPDNKFGTKAKTVGQVMGLLATHFGGVQEAFPLVEHDLNLWLDDADPGNQLVTLNLPPWSAFYTTYEYWWSSLRFADYRTESKKIGGRGSQSVTTRVWGYWNETREPMVIKSEEPVPAEAVMNALLNVVHKTNLPPSTVQFQAEVENWPPLPFELDDEVELTAEGVTAGFDQLFEKVRLNLNLAYRPLLTHTTPEGRLSLTNYVVPRKPDYFSTFTVRFDRDLALALGVVDAPCHFQMDLVKHLPLAGIKRKFADPFEGRYPIMLVCTNHGEATSHVEGLEYVPILGVLTGMGTQLSPLPMAFSADRQTAYIEFYDKSMNKLVFDVDVELFLLLEFTPVSVHRIPTIEEEIARRQQQEGVEWR